MTRAMSGITADDVFRVLESRYGAADDGRRDGDGSGDGDVDVESSLDAMDPLTQQMFRDEFGIEKKNKPEAVTVTEKTRPGPAGIASVLSRVGRESRSVGLAGILPRPSEKVKAQGLESPDGESEEIENPFGYFEAPKAGPWYTELGRGAMEAVDFFSPPMFKSEVGVTQSMGVFGAVGKIAAGSVPSAIALVNPEISAPIVMAMFAGSSASERFNETGSVPAAIGSGVFDAASEAMGLSITGKIGTKAATSLGEMILSKNYKPAVEMIASLAGIPVAEGVEELVPLAGDMFIDVVEGRRSIGEAMDALKNEAPITFAGGALGGSLLTIPAMATPAGRAAVREAMALSRDFGREKINSTDIQAPEPQREGVLNGNQIIGQGQVPSQEQVGQEPQQAAEQVGGGETATAGGIFQAQEGMTGEFTLSPSKPLGHTGNQPHEKTTAPHAEAVRTGDPSQVLFAPDSQHTQQDADIVRSSARPAEKPAREYSKRALEDDLIARRPDLDEVNKMIDAMVMSGEMNVEPTSTFGGKFPAVVREALEHLSPLQFKNMVAKGILRENVPGGKAEDYIGELERVFPGHGIDIFIEGIESMIGGKKLELRRAIADVRGNLDDPLGQFKAVYYETINPAKLDRPKQMIVDMSLLPAGMRLSINGFEYEIDLDADTGEMVLFGSGVEIPTSPLKSVPVDVGSISIGDFDKLPGPVNLLPGGRQAGGADFFHDIVQETRGLAARAISASKNTAKAISRFTREKTARAADFIQEQGPVGAEVADKVRKIDLAASQRAKSAEVKIRDILKGADLKTRQAIGMAVNGLVPNPSRAIKQRADALRRILDDTLLLPARELGFQRRLPSGDKALVGGSGRAMPQVANAKGLEILTEAKVRGLASKRVAARAYEMVNDGRAATLDEALAALRRAYDDLNRGLVPYLERSRTDFLKPDEIEWDPDKVLTGLIERTSIAIEAASEFGGPDLPGLDAAMMKMGAETDPHNVLVIDGYLKTEFGRPNPVDTAVSKALAVASNYLSVTRIGVSPTTNFRNSNQRYANAFDYPVGVLLKTVKEYPPYFHQFMRSAQDVKKKLESLGVIRSTSDLGSVETGVPGRRATDATLSQFAKTEGNNQTFASILAKNAVESDIHRLVEIDRARNAGQEGRVEKLMNVFLEPVSKRRLARLSVDDVNILADKVASGERLAFDDVQQAMNRAVLDTQFPLTLSTKPLWWSNNPWMRLWLKFKPFGVRQAQLIHNVAFKEAVKGNIAPLGRLVAYMIFTGELYYILRDLLVGSEDSLTMSMIQRPDRRNQTEVGWRLLADMAGGGGLAFLADVTYGLASFAGGPAATSLGNASDAVMDAWYRPSEILTVMRRFAEKEVSAVKQLNFLNYIDKAMFNRENEVIANRLWRLRAHEFADRKREPSAAARLVEDIVEGREDFGRGPNTLMYEYAARQVDVGDVNDAAEYLRTIFSGAKDGSELVKMIRGARQSARSRSPLGALARQDLAKFLSPYSDDQKREAMRLQRSFIVGYNRAISKAIKMSTEGRNDSVAVANESQPMR